MIRLLVMAATTCTLLLSGCGGGDKLPASELQAKADFLRDLHEYEWQYFEDFRKRLDEYVPGSQPWRDEYMMLVEARDRARRTGREYLAFLNNFGRPARAERTKIESRLKALDRLEQDIPYR